ncbi:hypothetical protein KGF56_003414 [Candida oxycetoniae]|uniref:Bromodomain associated domain-containing protein n=1 Tax=Candida oxycetoniae TaxID=497107 RepID=A0AAI9SW19_9ASCO|nr:uncharacterized protein KGF56_003414 [Candida oxycetoniae]KAI3403779.1 hypothetical protein KGF56_003414 [Candida oxycetoniae]
MMEDSFNFSLLRISIAQILKAHGVDKCKPSLLNIVTDIYIEFFTRLVQESIKCSHLRISSNEPELQDVMQSMINIGFIKARFPLRIHDEYFKEDEEYNTKSVNSFRDWVFKSFGFSVASKLNQVPQGLVNGLVEKRKLDLDDAAETEAEKRRRKHKERQEFYNQLKLNDDQQKQAEEDLRKREEEEEKEKERDNVRSEVIESQSEQDKQQLKNMKWLNYLLEKDLKLGHDLKFFNANEFIAGEFLKFQNNKEVHPMAGDSTSNSGFSDKDDYYLVSEIPKHQFSEEDETSTVAKAKEKEKESEGTVNEKIIADEAVVREYLPYKLKYPDALLSDTIERSNTD